MHPEKFQRICLTLKTNKSYHRLSQGADTTTAHVHRQDQKLNMKDSQAIPAPDPGSLYKEVSRAEAGVTCRITSSASTLGVEWDMLAQTPLLQRSYLEAIEAAPPHGMQFVYLLMLENGHPMAIFYFQEVPFQAGSSLNYQAEEGASSDRCPSFFGQLHQLMRVQVAKKIGFSTLVCGNLLLTGPYGCRFDDSIPAERHHALIEKAYSEVQVWLKKNGREHPPVQLIKEFYSISAEEIPFHGQKKWHAFRIQPNHVLHLPAHWSDFEDYLKALQSKYRVRYRRAKKKLAGVDIQELSSQQIAEETDSLYALYLQIAGNAGFNMVHLQASYLKNVKAGAGEYFRVFAFKKEEKIIGFFSYFICGDTMDVHYIGLDKAENINHQLYLNMLFQIIDDALVLGCRHINFGRTAPEIKSSVGAETIPMDCYIRHQSGWVQKTVPLLMSFLQPRFKWEERHPFHQEKN
jgi:hypothetical protein